MPAATQMINILNFTTRVRTLIYFSSYQRREKKNVHYLSVYDNVLVCICEIRPVIDNDILTILGDFVRI